MNTSYTKFWPAHCAPWHTGANPSEIPKHSNNLENPKNIESGSKIRIRNSGIFWINGLSCHFTAFTINTVVFSNFFKNKCMK